MADMHGEEYLDRNKRDHGQNVSYCPPKQPSSCHPWTLLEYGWKWQQDAPHLATYLPQPVFKDMLMAKEEVNSRTWEFFFHLQQWSPTFLALGTGFVEEIFFTAPQG